MEYALLAASAAVSAVANALGGLRPPRPTRFLVVKLDHLGDVVTATPVFRALREGYPEAPVDALVGPLGHEVLDGNPHVSRLYVYDSPRFRRNGSIPSNGAVGAPGRADGAAAALREVSRGGYSHIVELRGDARTLLLPFRCGALRRVDRGTVRAGLWLARRRAPGGEEPRARDPIHEVESNLAVVRPLLGGRAPSDRVEIFLREEERAAARKRLAGDGVDATRPLVVFHAGAAWRPRAWPADRFAEVARRLGRSRGAAVAFVGAASERDIEAAIRAHAADLPAAYVFGAPLRETLAVIAEAALFVGNDSGLAHAAAACGTPVVALFGPQDPRRFAPWSARTTVLHHPVPCFPCAQVRCVRPELPCVSLISVEETTAAAERLVPGGVA